VAGKLNKQIADLMDISIKTVEVHRSRVMEKMQVTNVAELVRQKLSFSEGAKKKPA
jgi:FixJ family two-component response regulator